MSRLDGNIVKCAERLVKRLRQGDCYMMNGEYLKPVQIEIDRMLKLARKEDATQPLKRRVFAWYFHNDDGRVVFLETPEVKERLEKEGVEVTPLFTMHKSK